MDVFEKGLFYGKKLHPSRTGQGIPDADNYSNFLGGLGVKLGIESPEKYAARKQAKAEKKLEKAEHANPKKAERLRKAAERKLGKSDKVATKYGLNTPYSSVDVGTQSEDDSVLQTTTPQLANGTGEVTVAAVAAPPPQSPTPVQPLPVMPYPMQQMAEPVDATRMMIYGGIGLATLFVVGVLLSRHGEYKMAKN